MTRIAVIGSGAVGGYYGALLARAGEDVRFLMRRDLEAVRRNGLRVESPLGEFHLRKVQVFSEAREIGEVDWVVCALKTTALDEARTLIEPCLGRESRLLALMNGLGIEERFAEWMPAERIFGGMAFTCINRGEPGVVRHLDYGRITIGHLNDDPAEAESLRELLNGAGIEVAVAGSLRQARWEKLCWNIPFNGLSVAAGGVGTRAILETPALRETAERAMREVVAEAQADLVLAGGGSTLDADEIVGPMFALTEEMGDYRTSMAIDYALGRPLEVESILGEPLRRACMLGVEVPTVATLYAVVLAADQRNRGILASIRD